MEDRLQCIRSTKERINGYIDFMCDIGNLTGSSPEEKEKAIAVFCEHLVLLERRLARIQEDLRLG